LAEVKALMNEGLLSEAEAKALMNEGLLSEAEAAQIETINGKTAMISYQRGTRD
jgi:hypothetical protein